MLIFAKDLRKKGHEHSRENLDLGLKKYMEYQRSLFPYTIVRAGLDLAYKELDDILNYMDNNYSPPQIPKEKSSLLMYLNGIKITTLGHRISWTWKTRIPF